MANLSEHKPEQWLDCPHCSDEQQNVKITFFGGKKGVVIACQGCDHFAY
jgi:uncharacterized Zn finger protein